MLKFGPPPKRYKKQNVITTPISQTPQKRQHASLSSALVGPHEVFIVIDSSDEEPVAKVSIMSVTICK